MRTLLLFAKHIALSEDCFKLYKEHLTAALLCLKPHVNANTSSRTIYEKLCDILLPAPADVLMMADNYRAEISRDTLEQMVSRPVLPFSSQLSAILDTLQPLATSDNWINDTQLFRIPDESASYREQLSRLEQLKQTLLGEVYGQDQAVEYLIDSMVKGVWQPQQNRPQGLFFFAGPPASGKTFLAERFAHHLGDGYHYKYFDMTQYTNANESFGLVGAKKTYDDSAPGELTSFVDKHPKSVLVFDEFEKAHTQVLLSLLRMLSAGELTDEYTQKDVDFRQTIVLFTSNLGSAMYNKPDYLASIENRPEQARAAMITELRSETKIERDRQVKAIPPEMLSRLSQGSIVLFKALGVNELLCVAENQLQKDLQHFTGKSQIGVLPLCTNTIRMLLTTFAPFFDIRDIKANITGKVLDHVTDFIRVNPGAIIKEVRVALADDVLALLNEASCETHIQSLKVRNEAFFADAGCRIDDGTLTVTFSNPESRLLINSDDAGCSGGIVLDMPNTGFDDIAGHDAVKARLKETINILRHGEALVKAGVSAPKGMVLFGPPGTGKTTLARALASEAGMPIATCSGNELLADNFIETLFARVRKYAPCILFIDEIDALPKRGQAGPKADALINRLLTEIDGFTQSRAPVFIVAATNRLDKLDDALLRSGRLDLHVRVPFLDKAARRWFIEKFLRYDGYSGDIDVELIVSLTAGMSGADLEKIHREAVLRALSKGATQISQAMLTEEINILKYGAKRSLDNCEKTLAETAYHEAGHAVISKILMPERVIEQISVVPREQALGMVAYANDQNIDYTKAFWFFRTCVALAGRAAQVAQFGEEGLDTGASSDLKSAMWSAWSAIGKYGMHADSYNMDVTALKDMAGETYFKQHTEKLIKQWIDDATVKTEALVKQHWSKIEAVAQALLDKEVLSEAQFMALLHD
ncbi:AAA family ATPase [Aestuariibacter sp. A3R04]|uniref:AAA family ATPase n=1 Tax=Aestuariibacter sp. A3R04 TaxID=2841571 RepID=UPI001C083A14|nr:AAA family ATPase [Aestuariibacter sp. A3R04]MBU3023788.1 AAA family ATPase [Aestuariibacter sp. A3R04]